MAQLIGTRRTLLSAVPTRYAVLYDGANTTIAIDSGADIDDLPTSANGFTAEVWARADSAGEANVAGYTLKGSAAAGWWLRRVNTTTLRFRVVYDGTISSATATIAATSTWRHYACTYNENDDRKSRLWIQGVLVATGAVSIGSYVTDAAYNYTFGQIAGRSFDGAISWGRLSNFVRYSATFTPPDRFNPPAIDANTLRQHNFNEGAGVTLVDATGNANGTISYGTWVTTR